MKAVKLILIGLIGAVALLAAGSLALPATYKVERSIDINAPMIAVYPQVYDPKAWRRWGVWYGRDPAMAITYSGAPAGVGAKWSWRSKSQGDGAMEITRADFDRRVAYNMTMGGFDRAMPGRLDFAIAGKAVRVTWTIEGEAGANPLMRYFGLAMDRMVGPDFETSLKNLKALAEAEAAVNRQSPERSTQ